MRLCCCFFLFILILIPTFFCATRATLLQDLVLFLVFMLSHGTHTHTRTGWTLHLQLRCRWLRRVLLTFNYSIFRGFVRLYFVVVAVVVAELLLWGLKIPFIVCTLQTVVHVITNSTPPSCSHRPPSLNVHLMGIMNSSLTWACISSTNLKSSCHVLCQAPKTKRKHLHRTHKKLSTIYIISYA